MVTRGTMPRQDTFHGHLGELQQRLRDSSAQKDPAVLVVGAVAGLREHLRWFDTRPLFGKRVLVTKSREQAGELVERLEDLGAEAIEAPIVRIAPPQDFGPLDEACAKAATLRLDRVHQRQRRRVVHAPAAGRARATCAACTGRGSAPWVRAPRSAWRGGASRST